MTFPMMHWGGPGTPRGTRLEGGPRLRRTAGRIWEGGPGPSPPEGPEEREGPDSPPPSLGPEEREGPDCWASGRYALEKRLSCLTYFFTI